jgi:hypothetical protein
MSANTCPQCGSEVRPGAKFCNHCGAPLAAGGVAARSGLSIQERKRILDQEVSKHVSNGWRVISQTDTTAQLTRQTPASCGLALLLAIFLIVPAILYLMLYHGTESLYIEVDEAGNIKATPG